MSDLELSTCAALLLGFGYLRYGRAAGLKRILLPLATAATAALAALSILRTTDGRFFDYAVAVPLALSGGMLLQHAFDFCRQCGAARHRVRATLRVAAGEGPGSAATAHRRCTGCRTPLG